jgi:hypothetical protein
MQDLSNPIFNHMIQKLQSVEHSWDIPEVIDEFVSGGYDDELVVDALIWLLKNDEREEFRQEAVRGLRSYGEQEKVRNALIEALKSESDSFVLQSIVLVLKPYVDTDPKVAAAMIELIVQDRDWCGLGAVQAVDALQSKMYVDRVALLAGLRSRQADVRDAAAQVLTKPMGYESVQGQLFRVLKEDDDVWNRNAVAAFLERRGDLDAVRDALIEAWKSESDDLVQSTIVSSLLPWIGYDGVATALGDDAAASASLTSYGHGVRARLQPICEKSTLPGRFDRVWPVDAGRNIDYGALVRMTSPINNPTITTFEPIKIVYMLVDAVLPEQVDLANEPPVSRLPTQEDFTDMFQNGMPLIDDNLHQLLQRVNRKLDERRL